MLLGTRIVLSRLGGSRSSLELFILFIYSLFRSVLAFRRLWLNLMPNWILFPSCDRSFCRIYSQGIRLTEVRAVPARHRTM